MSRTPATRALAWIFQGNPEVFDIEGYLAASSGLITWTVVRYADQNLTGRYRLHLAIEGAGCSSGWQLGCGNNAERHGVDQASLEAATSSLRPPSSSKLYLPPIVQVLSSVGAVDQRGIGAAGGIHGRGMEPTVLEDIFDGVVPACGFGIARAWPRAARRESEAGASAMGSKYDMRLRSTLSWRPAVKVP
jgi:hypothetical protein